MCVHVFVCICVSVCVCVCVYATQCVRLVTNAVFWERVLSLIPLHLGIIVSTPLAHTGTLGSV